MRISLKKAAHADAEWGRAQEIRVSPRALRGDVGKQSHTWGLRRNEQEIPHLPAKCAVRYGARTFSWKPAFENSLSWEFSSGVSYFWDVVFGSLGF